MAFMFKKGVKGKYWNNGVFQDNIRIREPDVFAKTADILITHSKIDSDLAEIILAFKQLKNGVDISNIKVKEKDLSKFMSRRSFALKIEILECNNIVNPKGKYKNFFQDMKNLNELRNKIAHSNLIIKFGIKDVSIEHGYGYPTEKIGESPYLEFKQKDIENIFRNYTRVSDNYYDFFSMKLSDKMNVLMGEK